MGLGDITGVFSRYFVVGFFLPAYVSLVALWISATGDFIPDDLERYSEATELLILGGLALVAGLSLSGARYLVTRAFEGYPLLRLSRWPLGLVSRAAIRRQRASFHRLLAVRDDAARASSERSRAAWILDRFYPKDANELLPTRLGNAMRAFERHSNERWGLDGVTVWPRINALLSSEERQLHVDAQIDLYVFMNGALGAFVVGVCLVIDKAMYAPDPAWSWALYAIPFAVSYLLYRATVAPAASCGDLVRASIDLHRLELYEKLGMRTPTSFSDERELAVHLNKALLYARPLLTDDLWRGESDEGVPAADRRKTARGGGLFSGLKACLKRGGM